MEPDAMEWWIWIVAGLVCLVIEVLTPGAFVFIFFGIASLVVGALTATDILPSFWQQSTVLVTLAGVCLALFRRRLLTYFTPRKGQGPIDSMVGEAAVAVAAIAAGATGKVEFRGTSWSGYNAGTVDIAAGQRCRIEGSEELTLRVRAE